MSEAANRESFKLDGVRWTSRDETPKIQQTQFYTDYSNIVIDSAAPSILFHKDHVALFKSVETPKIYLKVGGVKCSALLDSGANVSLISDHIFNKCSNNISSNVNSMELITATGNQMNLLGEARLEISIGIINCLQEFLVTLPLVEDCILGVDFLVKHQVDLDFDRRVVKGPRLGMVMMSEKWDRKCPMDQNIEYAPYKSCSVHTGLCDSQTPNSFDLDKNDDWECRGIVPDYRNTPVFESPVVAPDFQEVLDEYRDLIFSVPGVASVEEFQIRTGDAGAIRTPPRMVPQAYQQEVHLQIEEMLRKNIIRVSSSSWISPSVMVNKKDGTIRFCIDYRALNRVT